MCLDLPCLNLAAVSTCAGFAPQILSILSSIAESTLTFGRLPDRVDSVQMPTMPSVVIAAIPCHRQRWFMQQLRTGNCAPRRQVTQRLLHSPLTALNSMYAVIVEKLAAGVLHQEIYGNTLANHRQPLYLLLCSLVLFLGARAPVQPAVSAAQYRRRTFVRALFWLVCLPSPSPMFQAVAILRCWPLASS